MEDFSELINTVTSQKYSDLTQIKLALEDIESIIRKEVLSRIDSIPIEQIGIIRREKMKNLLTDFNIGMEWDIKTALGVPSASNGSISIPANYKISITGNPQELVEKLFNSLKKAVEDPIMKYSSNALLDSISRFYKSLRDRNELQVDSCSPDNHHRISIEEDLEYLIEMHFRVIMVKCEGQYANGDYFEMYEANIQQPTTIKKALVSADDGILCISKGIYVSPKNIQ